ncbi:MAG TPA: porin [Thiothrix sp.]|nr:porin [Thiothrix sp.]
MMNKITLSLAVSLGLGFVSSVYAETTEEKVQRLEAELNALADTVEKESSSASTPSRTKLGGYGELHYNNIDGADAKIDFHRFILFIGHEFNETIRFFSEFELEHSIAGDGENGAVELEQAYIEMDLNAKHAAKAGLFLMPVGIINETHEPPVFYGVERNPLEKNIIPATWWEAGMTLSGQLSNAGVSYDAALTSGLAVDATDVNIRSGRQKVSKATAENLALTGRLKYTGMPGVELAGTVSVQDDITQASGDGVNGAVLTEVHAIVNKSRFGAIAQYAAWDIDIDTAAIQNKDKQDGYLLEGSFKVTPKLGLFARHVGWSNTAGTDKEQQNIGVSFWPHENVVLKADIQQQNVAAGDGDGFNLGVGYHF